MLSFVKKIARNYKQSRQYRPRVQEEYDWLKTYNCVKFRQNFAQRQASDPGKFSLQALREKKLTKADLLPLYEYDRSLLESPSARYDYILRNLDPQMYDLFEYVQKKGGENPYPKPVFRKKEADLFTAASGVDTTYQYIHRKMNIREVEIYNPGVEILHPDGFSLCIRKSKVDHPESGYGVFLDGVALPGTILALYPGTVYFPNNLTEDITNDNDYMFARYDGAVVDGRGWDRLAEKAARDIVALRYSTSGKTTTTQISLKKFRNPFGIANYINHPPPGADANVLCIAYDFPAETPTEFQEYIPNVYSIQPPMAYRRYNTVMHSVACIAIRPIIDEELFLNYRYNPEHPYPDWYVQPDEDAAKRRWAKPTMW